MHLERGVCRGINAEEKKHDKRILFFDANSDFNDRIPDCVRCITVSPGYLYCNSNVDLTMKHQIQFWRDEMMITCLGASSLDRGLKTIDQMITDAHNGVAGIGKFSIFLYELAEEGHIEKCGKAVEPFYCPARKKETV